MVVAAAVAPMFSRTLAPASYCNEPTRSGLPSLLKSPTARNSSMMSVWFWVPYIMTEPLGAVEYIAAPICKDGSQSAGTIKVRSHN